MVKKSDEGDGGGVDTIISTFDEGEPLEEVPWEHKCILFFFFWMNVHVEILVEKLRLQDRSKLLIS